MYAIIDYGVKIMFTIETREKILNDVVDYAYSLQEVVAVLVIGSGAIGFKDNLSDIDLSIIVRQSLDEVMDCVKKYIESNFTLLISLEDKEKRHMQVFFTDEMLELDVGYQRQAEAQVTKPAWIVMKDKTDTLESILAQQWNKKIIEKEKTKDSLCKKQKDVLDEFVWHYLYIAIKSIKRNEVFRAIKEMEHARNLLIETLCMHYGIDSDRRFKGVDDLPLDVKEKLVMTYPVEMNHTALHKAVKNLIAFVYEVSDTVYLPFDAINNYYVDVNQK